MKHEVYQVVRGLVIKTKGRTAHQQPKRSKVLTPRDRLAMAIASKRREEHNLQSNYWGGLKARAKSSAKTLARHLQRCRKRYSAERFRAYYFSLKGKYPNGEKP